ncbi:NADPH-dependent FMN reductase [Phenylobacterium sp. J367]|uniref:NADPH-dependent FMN reductase n=1 Tax=Phenylobacterium sp. J367 TaxID=2898435 RepID=UPI002151AF3A|nr:NAD(P)H-dependent oxidoreductase [Phenylobacterium sp. J367]MCR5880849.1 NAD(P)H-dependent oxidoreductase [Phenylobacterium sp. J367]
MTQAYTVAVLVGSLRKDSASRKIAQAIADEAPKGLTFKVVEIGDLPHYDPDLETDTPPAAWTRFRQELADVDGFLFVTPEYNRSVPGFLKNAIDVGSRPWGKAVFTDKPAAIVSTSAGALGGFGANHHLRQMISFFGMPLLGQPEAYIGNSLSLFDESGALVNEATTDFLKTFGQALAHFVAKNAPHAADRKAA